MKIFRSISFVFLALIATCATARDFNDKLMNRPYADSRRFHLGFSVGTFVSGLNLTHNGLVSETDGSQW